jgi:hypothetical protein
LGEKSSLFKCNHVKYQSIISPHGGDVSEADRGVLLPKQDYLEGDVSEADRGVLLPKQDYPLGGDVSEADRGVLLPKQDHLVRY